MMINQDLLDKLFEEAKGNPRLRTNLDLRTSTEDGKVTLKESERIYAQKMVCMDVRCRKACGIP